MTPLRSKQDFKLWNINGRFLTEGKYEQIYFTTSGHQILQRIILGVRFVIRHQRGRITKLFLWSRNLKENICFKWLFGWNFQFCIFEICKKMSPNRPKAAKKVFYVSNLLKNEPQIGRMPIKKYFMFQIC